VTNLLHGQCQLESFSARVDVLELAKFTVRIIAAALCHSLADPAEVGATASCAAGATGATGTSTTSKNSAQTAFAEQRAQRVLENSRQQVTQSEGAGAASNEDKPPPSLLIAPISGLVAMNPLTAAPIPLVAAWPISPTALPTLPLARSPTALPMCSTVLRAPLTASPIAPMFFSFVFESS
jgi:hypothetical protein